MIRNRRKLEEFERELMRKEKPDYFRNLKLYEAMYEYAVELGVLPSKDPLEGIEWKIEFVRRLNVL